MPILPECRECDLATSGCKTVGLPSHVLSPIDPSKPVLVVMGHQPGRDEDSNREVFTGPSGRLLRKVFLEPLGLAESCNVVLTNLVRCWPLVDKPRPVHIRACHGHLAHDLSSLSQLPGPHFLLTLGGEVPKALFNQSLSESLRSNCWEWCPPWLPVPWTVVSTFHPAFLLSRRNPNAIHAVADHLQLLLDRLDGGAILRSTPSVVKAGPPRIRL